MERTCTDFSAIRARPLHRWHIIAIRNWSEHLATIIRHCTAAKTTLPRHCVTKSPIGTRDSSECGNRRAAPRTVRLVIAGIAMIGLALGVAVLIVVLVSQNGSRRSCAPNFEPHGYATIPPRGPAIRLVGPQGRETRAVPGVRRRHPTRRSRACVRTMPLAAGIFFAACSRCGAQSGGLGDRIC